MADEANALPLLQSRLREPLTGADLFWLALIIDRHGGLLHYATVSIEQKTETQSRDDAPRRAISDGLREDIPACVSRNEDVG